MLLNDLKKRLGYRRVPDMLELVNMSYDNITRIKQHNPNRYRMIVNDIVLKHYDVKLEELISIVESVRHVEGGSSLAVHAAVDCGADCSVKCHT